MCIGGKDAQMDEAEQACGSTFGVMFNERVRARTETADQTCWSVVMMAK